MQSIQTLNLSLYQDSSCYSMFNTKLTPPQIVVCDNSIPIWAHNIVVDAFRHNFDDSSGRGKCSWFCGEHKKLSKCTSNRKTFDSDISTAGFLPNFT